MASTDNHISFQQVFRPIYVIFFLSLMQDVFFRWDGVSYFTTISKFLPSVALISILWGITAIITSFIIWLSLKVLKYICHRIKWHINLDNLLLFICFFFSLVVIVVISKRYLFGAGSSFLLKLVVLLSVIAFSFLFTWIFRGKLGAIQERITPLVWLFSIIIIISLPLVLYNVWIKDHEKSISLETKLSSTDKNRPNIILITFDALTARDMSVYNYHRPTTPFIRKWANNATVFSRAEAEANYTFPTTLSLMTGKRQWTHRQYNPNGRTWLTPENMPKILKKYGYYNMAFVQNPLASVDRLGIRAYFDVAPGVGTFNRPRSLSGLANDLLYEFIGDRILLYDWLTKPDFLFGIFLNHISKTIYVTEYPPERVFNGVLSELSNTPPEPFFLWAHLNPPHDPYLPPKEYMGIFNSSPLLRTQESQYKFTRSEEASDKILEQETADILRARYDEFITYCDNQFNYFIDQLEKTGALKNTVIILSADHGESFEHNYITHGGSHLYEQVTHIPLIIKEPGQTEGRIIDDLVEQVDISATILQLADIPVPSWMEGRSLKPLMDGKSLIPRPIFSMALFKNYGKMHKITRGMIAVWDGDYKLMHILEENKTLLFNLKKDPNELNNLINENPEISTRLVTTIKNNLSKANEINTNAKQ